MEEQYTCVFTSKDMLSFLQISLNAILAEMQQVVVEELFIC